MLQRQALPKRNVNPFNSQLKQSKSFVILGHKLPRLFVLIMCILILIIFLLILEISHNTQQDSNPSKSNTQLTPTIANQPEIYMKNKITLETAPKNIIPVLIFCHVRPQYLTRTLRSVYKQLNKKKWYEKFVIFISQDGSHRGIQQIIEKYAKQQKAYWLHFDYGATSRKMMKGFDQEAWRVYHKISAHYKWALNKMLIELDYKKIIILEEDMEISPDFFNYFYNLSPLLDMDKSIYCISAWNDYGQIGLVNDPNALYRTDVFPGLGWMLTHELWEELRYNISLAFWDDWFREPKQTKNRSCIRPEISRTYTFGQIGSSSGWFYAQFLEKMQLNKENIDWSKQDVTYLLNTNYDEYLKELIKNAKEIVHEDLKRSNMRKIEVGKDCVVYYNDLEHYSKMSKDLNLMQDHKFGLPRTSYRGIVIVYWRGHKILWVPKNVDWTAKTKYELNTKIVRQLQSGDNTEKSVPWNFFS